MNRYHKLSGFVIKRINYGEADKIITVFSLEQGKQTFIAKGIRKIKSRRAGALELFNHIKFLSLQYHGMGMITEVELLNSYQSLASDIFKTNIAYQIVELIDRLTQDSQVQEEVYELLIKAMPYIKDNQFSQDKYEQVLVRFKTKILEVLGFGVPSVQTNQALTQHIEEIIERELVAGKNFQL